MGSATRTDKADPREGTTIEVVQERLAAGGMLEQLVESLNDLLPPLHVGNDLDHVLLEALFVVVPGPPTTTVEVNEVSPPTLRKD